MDLNIDLNTKKPKYIRIIKEVMIFAIELGLIVALAFAFVRFGLEKTVIYGNSMETTLKAGDKVIINKLAYLRKGPGRYDVIVFKKNNEQQNYYNVKRVIGIPGDTVLIENGKVFINGEEYKEKLKVEEIRVSGTAAEPIVLREDEYFVLGDNRNYSEDSRFANIGIIRREEIVGSAWLRLGPIAIVDKINTEK